MEKIKCPKCGADCNYQFNIDDEDTQQDNDQN